MASFFALRGLRSALSRPAIMPCHRLAASTTRAGRTFTAASAARTAAILPATSSLYTTNILTRLPAIPARGYATGAASTEKKKKKKKRKRGDQQPRDRTEDERKLRAIRTNIFHEPPPPLRMGRNRHLRHWTIHRAWLLRQRFRREARQAELTRLRQSMAAACEELRLTDGPGDRDRGYLYRVAMEKKGVYGPGGVPIEYARLQTETPAKEPWKYSWKGRRE